MAFSPFSVFRKHKKAMFAVLTILCMFVFVLQAGFGGGADPLDRLAGLFGGRAMRANDIASLDGKPITPPDLIMVQRQRELANAYMMAASAEAADNFQKLSLAAMTGKDQLSPLDPKDSHGAYQRNARALMAYINPPRLAFLSGMRGFQRPAYFEAENVDRPFSGTNLVDFLVWKQMAKKLGINLTDTAVNEELNRMLLGGLTPSISRKVERYLDGRFPGTSLKEALRDELNVRLAKAAILGEAFPQMITAHVPVAITPYEFKEFFNDQRTELEVAFLPVRVEDYLNQVTTQPTERDLERLYERFKDQEYDPTFRPGEPGFRQPRRIQVQFIGGDPESPYYRQKAQELATVQEGLRRLTAATPAGPLAGLLPTATSTALPVILDLPLAADYSVQRFTNLRLPGWSEGIRPPVRSAAVFQPAAIASAIGQATAFPIVWPAFEAQSIAAEKAERLDIAIGTLLAPSPVAAAALVAKLYPRETIPSLASVEAWLRARQLDELARAALTANLDTVRKQIDELRKGKKLDELDKLVAGLAVNFHLQTGKSTGLRDLHKEPIGDDPGLQSLREVYLRLPELTRAMLFRRNDPQMNFGNTVFNPPGRPAQHEIETWQGFTRGGKGNSFDITPPGAGLDFERMDPDPWRSAPYLYLVWKTDEQPSRVLPLTDPTVRKEVEKAWRFEEARKLARKAAEELAKEATDLKGDLPKLRDFALRHKEELIERDLPRLAKRIKVEELRPEFPLRYRMPTIPESRIGEIGHPGEPNFGVPPEPSYSRFMDKILALKDQPVGSAVAVSNRPGSVYYVAVSLKKIEPSQEEFLRAYKEATGTGERRGDFFRYFMQTQATNFYTDFMKALREEAKLKVNEDSLESFDGGESRY